MNLLWFALAAGFLYAFIRLVAAVERVAGALDVPAISDAAHTLEAANARLRNAVNRAQGDSHAEPHR